MLNGIPIYPGYAKILSFSPKIMRTLYVGPITQKTNPSHPIWATNPSKRKGKLSNHNGGGRFYGNPRPLYAVNF
jgi:hypothetical protein